MKVIFFGLGSIGRKHVEILREKYPEIEIFAYRYSKGKLDNIKDVTNIYRLDEVNSSYKAAFICNPTYKHVETTLYCLDKGIYNIFIEKPLSNHTIGLSFFEKYYENLKANIYVAHNLRFNETLLKLKEIINRDAKIKDSVFYIDVIHSAYLPDWRKNIDYRKSYSASKEMGGGVILDMSHEFDYITWLFGEIDILDTAQISCGKISNLEITSEDYLDLLFGVKNKKITGRLHLDYFGLNTKRNINIFYRNGQIKADLIKERVKVYKNRNLVDIYPTNQYNVFDSTMKLSKNHSYERQIEYFIEAVKNCKNISNLKENINLIKNLIKIKYYNK